MIVLVVGSGAREHAIIRKLTQSKRVSKIYCAPGNPGIEELAECIDIRSDNINQLCEFALSNKIDLTVVVPERPCTLGIADLFKQNNLLIFAPDKEAVKISNSKSFAKNFMHRYKIPTPKFGVFDKESAAIEYVKKASKYPLVIKYDYHTNAQSSFLCETPIKAIKVIEECFSNLAKSIIIETYVHGRELSFPVITDGYNAVPLVSSVVYKRPLEGDGGANTPGVGAYAPCPLVDAHLEEKIAAKVIFPALDGLSTAGNPYCGILNVDIIMDEHNKLQVIEFNSNLGDPEAQTILPLLDEDLFEIMYSTAIGALGDDYENFRINEDKTTTVVLLSGNYPLNPKKGSVIDGLDNIDDDDLYVFQGETQKNKYGELVTNGGRVLSVTAKAATLNRAHQRVYEAIDLINFDGMRYRKDIAKSQINSLKEFL